jgi:two-component system KDP operon response regulator KdpE
MTGQSYVQPLLLVLEDDPRMRRFLVSTLASSGFRSLHMGTYVPELTPIAQNDPDLVLLDVGGAGVDGLTLTARLREWTTAPILVLLEGVRGRQRVELLDAGANDYVVKPFGASDLLARIRVWLRQSARASRAPATHAPSAARLRIDRERQSVFVDGREVHLTPTECALLLALSHSRGAMTESQVVAAVWGSREASQAHQLVRAHVRQLRNKLERDPARPRHLVTDAAGSYRLRLG